MGGGGAGRAEVAEAGGGGWVGGGRAGRAEVAEAGWGGGAEGAEVEGAEGAEVEGAEERRTGGNRLLCGAAAARALLL